MELTIHAALGELKKLDQRINKSIFGGTFIGAKKKSAADVLGTGYSEDRYKETINSSMQSISSLIANYKAIKSAVVISNATTKLIVGKEEMTVAEAIERKSSIEYEKTLLRKLKNDRDNVVAQVNRQNEKVEEQLDTQISVLTANSKDKASSLTNLTGFIKEYRDQNSYELINPLDIDKVISELEERILDFETNVDVALSNSNALTKITI